LQSIYGGGWLPRRGAMIDGIFWRE
jgi:hypothetical protein